MVEQIINDGLGNVLTLRYDESTDTVSINNNNIHDNFREIYLNDAPDLIEDVITIENTNGNGEWLNYTDDFGKWEINLFWQAHKVDQVTRGLSL
jgi:hypothetical protein